MKEKNRNFGNPKENVEVENDDDAMVVYSDDSSGATTETDKDDTREKEEADQRGQQSQTPTTAGQEKILVQEGSCVREMKISNRSKKVITSENAITQTRVIAHRLCGDHPRLQEELLCINAKLKEMRADLDIKMIIWRMLQKKRNVPATIKTCS
mmetsp:Transcript_7770/g.11397  ORF Transcript_7770/g.11397 Transcript_7770/m.11397 type:complete len:154 (-) Transcript_7770:56-517(-)